MDLSPGPLEVNPVHRALHMLDAASLPAQLEARAQGSPAAACLLLRRPSCPFASLSLQPTGKMLSDGQLVQPLVYMERLELIRNVCRDEALKNLSHTAVSKFVLDRIFVCDKHKILFCQTPKVGNTQWKKVLIVLNGTCRARGVSSLGDFGVCPGRATVTWGWGGSRQGAGRSHRKGHLLRGAGNLSDSSVLCFSYECCTLKVSGVHLDRC